MALCQPSMRQNGVACIVGFQLFEILCLLGGHGSIKPQQLLVLGAESPGSVGADTEG